MGNIQSLTRHSNSSLVDQLTYGYAGTGNKLASLTDASGDTSPSFQLTGTTNYIYDANGNMTSRTNSTSGGNNISGTTYNHLDLPSSMDANGALIAYTYDAEGNKLKKLVTGIVNVNNEYIGGIHYEGGVLRYLSMETGRVVRNSATDYSYEYTLTDHLGNGRMFFNITSGGLANKIQETDYYAFGLDIQRFFNGTENKYQYNGKEKQDQEKMLDYGARFYDPVIGRFNTIDPLSEISRRNSPYNYALNNPVRFIDVDGMYADDPTITSVNKNGGVQTVSETDQSTKYGKAKNGVRTVTTTTTTASQEIYQPDSGNNLEFGKSSTSTSTTTATQSYDAESKSWVNNNDGKTTTSTVAGIDHEKFTNVGDAANTVRNYGIKDGNDYYSNIKQSGAFGMGVAAFGGTLPLTISGLEMKIPGLSGPANRFLGNIGPGTGVAVAQKMTANTPIIMAVGSYSQKVQNFNNTHPPAVRALQNALYKYTIGLFEPLFK